MPAFRSISRQGRTSVLLTGFGPFPGTPVNATMVLVPALAAAVQRAFPDVAVTAEILPTEWERAPSRVDALLDEAQPDISLHFGVSSRARGFEIEARGRNFRKDVADASGACPPECAVRDGAPEHLAARLPVAEIVTRMRRRGIAANVSWDAGGYLCNAVLYHVLAAARSRPELRRTGFVHVPTGLAALPVRGGAVRGDCGLTWPQAMEGGLELMAICLGRPHPAGAGRPQDWRRAGPVPTFVSARVTPA